MPGELALRRYRPANADAVWAVHEAALRASPLPFVEDAAVDEDLTAVEGHYLDAGGEFLVGEVAAGPDAADPPARGDARVVAIGGFLPVDDRTIEIRRMRVHPDAQRRGYGREVLAELEARARAAGHETAQLETIEPLRAARALYEAAGYEVVAETVQPETGDARYTYRRNL